MTNLSSISFVLGGSLQRQERNLKHELTELCYGETEEQRCQQCILNNQSNSHMEFLQACSSTLGYFLNLKVRGQGTSSEPGRRPQRCCRKCSPLLMLIPDPHPSGTAKSTALLTQMCFESWEESLTSKYTSLSFEGSEQYLMSDFHHAHKNDLYVPSELLEGLTPSFTHFQSVYYLMLGCKETLSKVEHPGWRRLCDHTAVITSVCSYRHCSSATTEFKIPQLSATFSPVYH